MCDPFCDWESRLADSYMHYTEYSAQFSKLAPSQD